jgi:hypothetical protein
MKVSPCKSTPDKTYNRMARQRASRKERLGGLTGASDEYLKAKKDDCGMYRNPGCQKINLT